MTGHHEAAVRKLLEDDGHLHQSQLAIARQLCDSRREEDVLRKAHDQTTITDANAELARVDHLLQLRGHVTEGLHALGRVALPLAESVELLPRGIEAPLHLRERRFDLAASRLQRIALLLTRDRSPRDAIASSPGVVTGRAGGACREDGPQRKLPARLSRQIVWMVHRTILSPRSPPLPPLFGERQLVDDDGVSAAASFASRHDGDRERDAGIAAAVKIVAVVVANVDVGAGVPIHRPGLRVRIDYQEGASRRTRSAGSLDR